MSEQKERNLELDRLVFFSDAVVAIAITLLALDLKIPNLGEHFTFADFWKMWHKFAAFLLSFTMIAIFWVIHHQFYAFIKGIDRMLMNLNIIWLFFIVLLPFSGSLISDHFFDKPAMIFYCLNILAIAILQNSIWDYVSKRKELLKETLSDETISHYKLACNLAMISAVVATGVVFISPLFAFIILLTRIVTFELSARNYERRSKEKRQGFRKMGRNGDKQKEE